jgi:formiminotetrahydrofolate cyclodeaminase
MLALVEPLNEYLTKLASEAPVPGGGSAAMVAGAEGCALVAMVARICAGSPKYAAVHSVAARLIADADALRQRMLELKTLDEAAYGEVVAARGDKAAMQRALQHAAEVPLTGAETALQALRLAADSLDLQNANLVSDVGCAAEFAYAALAGCAYNVRVNHKFMKDESTIAPQRERLDGFEREAGALLSAIRVTCRAQLSPA